jgi:hypothetical protein
MSFPLNIRRTRDVRGSLASKSTDEEGADEDQAEYARNSDRDATALATIAGE